MRQSFLKAVGEAATQHTPGMGQEPTPGDTKACSQVCPKALC